MEILSTLIGGLWMPQTSCVGSAWESLSDGRRNLFVDGGEQWTENDDISGLLRRLDYTYLRYCR